MGQNYKKPEPVGIRPEERPCLMCRETFLSEGVHNRICRRCRSSQVWKDGC